MSEDSARQHRSTVCARGPTVSVSGVRPLAPSIEISSVYCLADLDQVDALYNGQATGFIYARDGHPNAAQLAGKLARLEGGETGLVCASGMGAIGATMLSLLGQNDHLLISDGIYGKTSSLVTNWLWRWGIEHDVFDPSTSDATLRALVRPATRLIFTETISNPLLRVPDLGVLARIADEAGIPLIVDNTFAPLLCRPIEHGASLVIHSATKMIGGHSDLTLGVLVGARRLVEQARVVASTMGQTGNPFESWLALRGLATLSLRIDRAAATALELARRLEGHQNVERVVYPGLSSHPDFDLARLYLDASGGTMVTIDLATRGRADALIKSLRSIPFAPSLGDVQTTLSHPATTSHRGQDDARLARQGITPGMVRLSIGLEHPEDLWCELCEALDGLPAFVSRSGA
jgi:cystathionine beta-lyase/cystathionine gamma-synthase